MKEVEMNARTVEEAIQLALEKLGASREEVEVDVLSEGKRGLLGVGIEEAIVKVKLVATTPSEDLAETLEESDVVGITQDILETMLSRMGVNASVTYQTDAVVQESERDTPPFLFNIEGDELGILIGRRGQTLASFQYIVRLMASHQVKAPAIIVVDINGYKQRRYQSLQELASRMAEQVVIHKREFALEPMPAYERRIIHLALAGHPEVITESTGIGEARKVVISPR
jgi:spoIIIJ-associated protein